MDNEKIKECSKYISRYYGFYLFCFPETSFTIFDYILNSYIINKSSSINSSSSSSINTDTNSNKENLINYFFLIFYDLFNLNPIISIETSLLEVGFEDKKTKTFKFEERFFSWIRLFETSYMFFPIEEMTKENTCHYGFLECHKILIQLQLFNTFKNSVICDKVNLRDFKYNLELDSFYDPNFLVITLLIISINKFERKQEYNYFISVILKKIILKIINEKNNFVHKINDDLHNLFLLFLKNPNEGVIKLKQIYIQYCNRNIERQNQFLIEQNNVQDVLLKLGC